MDPESLEGFIPRLQPKLFDWIGGAILIRYMAGPDELPTEVGQVTKGQPEARTAFAFLEGIGLYGAIIRRRSDYPSTFIPWGSILSIQGPPEDMQQDQQEDTEESAPSPDRQEVMDLLASAETQPQIAVAKAAADSYLATHPSDGDVRMAREQLEARFPEETNPR